MANINPVVYIVLVVAVAGILVIIGGFSSLSSSNDITGQVVGDRCRSDSDCDPGEVCGAGFCFAAPGCSDSDGGQNFNVRGTTNLGSDSSTDSCRGSVLTEYYCNQNVPEKMDYNCASVGKVCQNGACVSPPPPSPDLAAHEPSTSTSLSGTVVVSSVGNVVQHQVVAQLNCGLQNIGTAAAIRTGVRNRCRLVTSQSSLANAYFTYNVGSISNFNLPVSGIFTWSGSQSVIWGVPSNVVSYLESLYQSTLNPSLSVPSLFMYYDLDWYPGSNGRIAESNEANNYVFEPIYVNASGITFEVLECITNADCSGGEVCSASNECVMPLPDLTPYLSSSGVTLTGTVDVDGSGNVVSHSVNVGYTCALKNIGTVAAVGTSTSSCQLKSNPPLTVIADNAMQTTSLNVPVGGVHTWTGSKPLYQNAQALAMLNSLYTYGSGNFASLDMSIDSDYPSITETNEANNGGISSVYVDALGITWS